MTDASGPRLIVVCGLPGSGKTTHAGGLAERLNGVRMSADDWLERLEVDLWDEAMRARIESLQWSLTLELLRLGQVVIVEWGTWSRSERDALRDGAKRLGAAVELHYLDVPVDVLWERIESRGLEDPPMTYGQLLGYAATIQPPTEAETERYDHVEMLGPRTNDERK